MGTNEKTFAFVLTVSESKRLIAKGVRALTYVQDAMESGKIIIANGITNAYVAEELTGQSIEKGRYTAGIVTGGQWDVTPNEGRLAPVVIENGQVSSRPWQDVLKEFTACDVFIKGANAIDLDGNAGVLVASPTGGTCGTALGTVYAAGAHLVVPAGLEKLVPSVPLAVRACGIHRMDESLGTKVGMYPVMGADIVTEIETLEYLFDVEAIAVSAGGVGGSEGSIGLVVTGDAGEVDQVQELITSIKGEPAVGNPIK